MKHYFTALWHCYDRYLNNLASGFNLNTIRTAQQLKQTLFTSSADQTNNIYQALFGHLLSRYQLTVIADPKLQNDMSVQALTGVLHTLRLMLGLQMETDHLCWLVYNTTIHTYTIGRLICISLG
jgi:hypothetical protein